MSQVTIYNGLGTANALGTFTMTVPLSIESETRVFRDETLSLRVIANDSTAQRWRISFNLAPDIGSSNPAPLFSVHKSVHSIARSFTMTMPQHHTVSASSGTTRDNGAVTLTTNEVTPITTDGAHTV